MSWQASRWARDQRAGSTPAKALLLVLAEQVDGAGSCFLSLATLGERAELSRSATIKHLATLEAHGLIDRTRRNDQFGHRTSDLIRLLGLPAHGPQDGPREASQGPQEEPRTAAKVHEKGRQGPRGGPEYVSEEKKRARAAPIPSGFPSAEAIQRERTFLAERGMNLDASLEAETFRAHAESSGRVAIDWAAAFHGWVVKSVQRAPASARVVVPLPSAPLSDDEIWRPRMAGLKTSGFWNATDWGPKPGRDGCLVPPAILAASGFNPDVPALRVRDAG
jgi:hypothetical protein